MSNFFEMLCPQCGRSSDFPSEAFGQRTRCPHCRAEVVATPAVSPPNPAIPLDCPADNAPEIPDLAACVKCGLTILKQSKTCPHCGERQQPRNVLVPTLAVVASAALLAGAAYLAANRYSGAIRPGASHRVMRAAIQFNDQRIFIRNEDSFDWRGAELYINGEPPYAFHFTLGDVRSGAGKIISLTDFIANGAPFQPAQTRVTNVWVGGPGFDFSSFSF